MIVGAILVLAGCRTIVPLDPVLVPDPEHDAIVTDADTPEDETAVAPTAAPDAGVFSERQVLLVQAAREIIKTQSTIVGTTTYSYDCSGTILTVFAHAGIYLVDLFPKYTGNGVARLHGIATDYEVLHTREWPEPGDVIFWDNTYDRNEDGIWNDQLTHAGIVISVAEDGTVEYLHHNYRRGIVTASMNLLKPEIYQNDEGSELNSPMRMASQRASNPDLWLSSHLFREFGSMHLIHIDTAGLPGQAAVASLP